MPVLLRAWLCLPCLEDGACGLFDADSTGILGWLQGLFFPILMTLGRQEPACYLADRACSLIYSQY